MPNYSAQEYRPAGGGWRAATASLQHRDFRWIFTSNAVYFLGMNGQFIVRSYLAFKLTDSAAALGIINLVVALPMLIVSPFGGVVSDRMDRKKLVLAGQVALIAGEFVIFGLLVADALAFWHLLAIVSLIGVVMPVMMPARQAIVADIVGRDGLPNAMALSMAGINAARIAGPAVAGYALSLFAVEWVYLGTIALYFVAMAAMTRVSPALGQAKEAREARTVKEDLAEGFRYVWNDKPVRALMVFSMLPILFAMPFQMLLVVFAEDVWDVGAGGLGLLNAFAGVGGILGSVIVAWRGDTNDRVRTMISTLLAFGGLLFLFAVSPWFYAALFLVLVADIAANIFQTTNSTVIQLLIPDHVRGRVMSIMFMMFGLTPLGTVPVGIAAEVFGAPAAVAGASVMMVVVGLLFFWASSALRSVDAVSREAERVRPRERTTRIGEASPAGRRPA
ncbi:MAG: MFS transporter [Dehalococcoidia bacterium]